MSKTRLSKELQKLTKQQLIEMILDHYSSRKDAKAYLDFYVNPEPGKLSEKYKTAITRELTRSKRKISKARISIIKKALKEFESFSPGTDFVMDLYLHTIKTAAIQRRLLEFSDTLANGIDSLTIRLLDIAAKDQSLDRAINDIGMITDGNSDTTALIRNHLRELVHKYLENNSLCYNKCQRRDSRH